MRTPSEVEQDWSRGISGTVFGEDRVTHVEHVWNTAISLAIRDTRGRDVEAAEAIRACVAWFAKVDATFSTYAPHTEVSFYRNGLDWSAQRSREFAEVLAACASMRALTRGSFDPWAVPGGFDPSGYVKGWAAGRASQLLRAAGFDHHLVNAGGDISAVGDEEPGTGRGWAVGIVNPHARNEVIDVVVLRDAAMATSGRSERGDHLVDPRTQEPVASVASATVIGPDPGAADAFASAAMVDGVAAMEWFMHLGEEWSLHLVIGETAFTHGAAFSA